MNQPKQILQLNLGLSIVYVPSFIVYWDILDANWRLHVAYVVC